MGSKLWVRQSLEMTVGSLLRPRGARSMQVLYATIYNDATIIQSQKGLGLAVRVEFGTGRYGADRAFLCNRIGLGRHYATINP